jgi:serine/threonine protein kinase
MNRSTVTLLRVQVDLYAVGAIAYEFIYGRPPFYRRDRAEKKSLILKGKLVFTTAFSVQAQVRSVAMPSAALTHGNHQCHSTRAAQAGVASRDAQATALRCEAGMHGTTTCVDTQGKFTCADCAHFVQHFIQKAMHANPACRGTATDLLNHQWILTNTGREVKPHWAPPEPAFAQSQIPGPPAKSGAMAPHDTPSRVHQYKYASGISPAAADAARETELGRTSTWDAASVARPDTKHRLDTQVSAVHRPSRCGIPAALDMPPTVTEAPAVGGLVRTAASLCCKHAAN